MLKEMLAVRGIPEAFMPPAGLGEDSERGEQRLEHGGLRIQMPQAPVECMKNSTSRTVGWTVSEVWSARAAS